MPYVTESLTALMHKMYNPCSNALYGACAQASRRRHTCRCTCARWACRRTSSASSRCVRARSASRCDRRSRCSPTSTRATRSCAAPSRRTRNAAALHTPQPHPSPCRHLRAVPPLRCLPAFMLRHTAGDRASDRVASESQSLLAFSLRAVRLRVVQFDYNRAMLRSLVIYSFLCNI